MVILTAGQAYGFSEQGSTIFVGFMFIAHATEITFPELLFGQTTVDSLGYFSRAIHRHPSPKKTHTHTYSQRHLWFDM